MNQAPRSDPAPHGGGAPSPWVRRFLHLARPGARALDLAAGYGRHARLLAQAGLAVEAVDRDPQAVAALAAIPGVVARAADLEAGPWPYGAACFDFVVVTNYLWRPRLPQLAAALAEDGVLVYETFGLGNERFGKPSNPDFLLRSGELLEFAQAAGLAVIGFESGVLGEPRAAVVERLCARRAVPGAAPAALTSAAAAL